MEKKKYLFKRTNKIGQLSLLVSMILLSGCTFLPKEEPALAPPLVEPAKLDYKTAEVEKGGIVQRVKGSGVMIPTTNHDLYYTKDGGRLKKIDVKEGDMVEKGQTLAELETGNLSFDIEQANIDLKKAEIKLQQMQAQGADKYSIEIGKLDVQSLKSRLSYMYTQQEESKITAPISGIVTYVTELKQGEAVPAYQSMFQVAETNQLQILYTATNPNTIEDVALGMDVNTIINGKEAKGEIVQTPKDVPQDIYEQDPNLYGKSLIIKVKDVPEKAKVGDYADIEIITAQGKDTLIIPRNGLRTIAGRNYVQIMEDNAKREVDVEVGIISSTDVEILKGLDEGDVIILK